MASDEFASRMTSPRPPTSGRPASIKAGHSDSPLRNEAEEQLDDSGEVIHIDHPAHRSSKIHGGGYDPPTEDLGPKGGNTAEEGGWVTERGYGIPILAPDELKKRGLDAEWRQPAISPELERHGDEYTVNEDGTPGYITKVRSLSRNSNRNNSTQVQRAIPSPTHFEKAGTPLEAHKEYEPLFPEDEESNKKPETQADKLKRPNLARHHFPSQDVWEDTPGSLQLETTVETPQAPEELEALAGGAGDASTAHVFEKKDVEEQRKTEVTDEDQQSFLSEEMKHPTVENKHLGKVRDDHAARPGMGQRFPSQDIWEDAPSHGHLETIVSAPQTEDVNEYAEESTVVEKPQVPARPAIPVRPVKKDISPSDKKAPIIPERPKPQVPARPSKPPASLLERVATTESQPGDNEAPQPKAKPPVPARPGGSKIAALQAGFLKDLNSKLGIGPQAPKFKEPEPEQREEAAPLKDARKGRAKGPQRRKPAGSPAPAATVTAEVAIPRVKLGFAPVTAIWSLNKDDILDVPAAEMSAKFQESLLAPTKSEKHNIAEDSSAEDADAEPRKAELSKTLTKDSEQPSDHESLLSKALSTVEAPLSKASSGPESSVPLVSEIAPGSVDAPAAFPGSESGSTVEAEAEAEAEADGDSDRDRNIAGGVLPEEGPGAKAEEPKGKDVEVPEASVPAASADSPAGSDVKS